MKSAENEKRGKSSANVIEKKIIPEYVNAWQMDVCFKCPVCGLCLSLSEQQHLLRKAGFSTKNMSSYDMHEIFVASLESECRISRMVDALLRRKYAGRAKHLLAAGDTEFLALWKISFEEDDQAALWAAAIRPCIPAEDMRKIFGWVHMSMHTGAAQHGKLMRELTSKADETAHMRQRLDEAQRARRGLQKENVEQCVMLDGLKTKLAHVRAENSRLKEELENRDVPASAVPVNEDIPCVRAERDELLKRLSDMQRDLSALQDEKRGLEQALREQREAAAQSALEIRQVLDQMRTAGKCDKSCMAYDLCQKRILIVGGITKMEGLYRQLIEGNGGVFYYHDGYVKGGVRKLEDSLKRADMVICPVNCNSHAACSLVKNLGKKYHKPVHILASSSLSSLMQAIGERTPEI